MTDNLPLLKQASLELGEDAALLAEVPDEVFDFVLENLPKFKDLLAKLRYNGRYTLGLDQVELEGWVKSHIAHALIQSDTVKKWYAARS